MRPLLSILLFSSLLYWNPSGAQESPSDPFYYIDTSKPVIDLSELEIHDATRAQIKQGSAILARSIPSTNRKRAQLVAVALAIDPEDELAYTTNLHLKRKETPPRINLEVEGKTGQAALDVVGNQFAKGVEVFTKSYRGHPNKESQLFSAMLHDALLTIYPNETRVIYARDMFLKDHDPFDWDTILLPSDPNFVPPSADNGNLELAQKQAGINALLITELSADMVGTASRMSATHLANEDNSHASRRLLFNQDVGETMQATLPEIAAFMEVRHNDWIGQGVIEFAFQEKIIPKDGDSAGLACGLMVESLVTGKKLDEKFTCTGSLNADGSVQPIGGVVAKLRGAEKSGCELLALPQANRYALSDITILGEASVLAKVQVFIVENFDQAWSIATTERSEDITTSIEEFRALQTQFDKAGVLQTIRSEAGQATLAKILDRTPHHASARLMMTVAQGRMPTQLSLNGSMEVLFNEFGRVIDNVVPPPFFQPNPQSDLETFSKAVAKLKSAEGKVEPRTRDFGKAVLDFAEVMEFQKKQDKVITDQALLQKGADAMNSIMKEFEKLKQDPELLEDIEVEGQ